MLRRSRPRRCRAPPGYFHTARLRSRRARIPVVRVMATCKDALRRRRVIRPHRDAFRCHPGTLLHTARRRRPGTLLDTAPRQRPGTLLRTVTAPRRRPGTLLDTVPRRCPGTLLHRPVLRPRPAIPLRRVMRRARLLRGMLRQRRVIQRWQRRGLLARRVPFRLQGPLVLRHPVCQARPWRLVCRRLTVSSGK